MTTSHREYTRRETRIFAACGIYAGLNVAFVLVSAAGLLGPTTPTTFLRLSSVSALLSIAALVWWCSRARIAAGFATAAILAAVAAIHLWLAHSAAV